RRDFRDRGQARLQYRLGLGVSDRFNMVRWRHHYLLPWRDRPLYFPNIRRDQEMAPRHRSQNSPPGARRHASDAMIHSPDTVISFECRRGATSAVKDTEAYDKR